MELDEQGKPIIPEDLKNKPRTEWTPEDWDRSGFSGRAIEGPDMAIAAGLMIGGPKAIAAWGTGRVLEAGLNLIAPDAEDTKLEQALDFHKPLKTGIKATRLMYERVLKDADVYSKSRFSSRLKREAGKKIIDDYLHKKVVQGPHKAWQDQNIPQGEMTSSIDAYRMEKHGRTGPYDLQGSASELPEGISAREWFKRVDEDIVKEEVFSQGGTEFQAKQIYRDHQKKLTGKKGIKATIKELNDMWNLWEPNTQIKLVSDTETGGKKMMMMTKTGNVKTWEFDHDHIQAVINTNRPEGGLKGADMAANIEIMFRAMNREKSNVFELDERLLRELGVPYDFKEYIFNKLNPDLVPEGIPQRWKEVFSKSILNDYYELKPNTPTSKHNALMGRLIRKYKKVFTNKELLADIEYLEDIPFWKKYPPNEIPKWAQTLELPNDPLTDKFWNQLPPKAKKRWENMVRRKHQELKFEMEGYKPSKGRYRIQPDD